MNNRNNYNQRIYNHKIFVWNKQPAKSWQTCHSNDLLLHFTRGKIWELKINRTTTYRPKTCSLLEPGTNINIGIVRPLSTQRLPGNQQACTWEIMIRFRFVYSSGPSEFTYSWHYKKYLCPHATFLIFNWSHRCRAKRFDYFTYKHDHRAAEITGWINKFQPESHKIINGNPIRIQRRAIRCCSKYQLITT